MTFLSWIPSLTIQRVMYSASNMCISSFNDASDLEVNYTRYLLNIKHFTNPEDPAISGTLM
jgi:hypothetical protein